MEKSETKKIPNVSAAVKSIQSAYFVAEDSLQPNPDLCDCSDRSWYGEGHDTACPQSTYPLIQAQILALLGDALTALGCEDEIEQARRSR